MSKFKTIHYFQKGDIVKVKNGSNSINKGSIGVVTDTSPICWEVSVLLDDDKRD